MGGLCLGASAARAQNATWVGGNGGDPTEWTEPNNWTTTTVPSGTATFANTGSTSIDNDNGFVSIGAIQFTGVDTPNVGDLNAQAYTINIYNAFLITGTGVVNNSNNTQTFNVTTSGSTGNTGTLVFQNGSSANAGAGAVVYNNDAFIYFENTSNAGNANTTIVNNEIIQFSNNSSAGSANIANNVEMDFFDSTTAGSANIANASGATVTFNNQSSAGTATISNSGALQFSNASTAGSATITTNSGGTISFVGASSGGEAAFTTNAGGAFDISGLTSGGTTAGSIAGAGNYFLGAKALTVGGDNLSSMVSGIISDGGHYGGAGGSLIKVGSGDLTLSGANTYSGGTTVNAGGVFVSGAGTLGTGPVALNSSVLFFQDATTAGSAAVTLSDQGLSQLVFADSSSADHAMITANGGNSTINFGDNSTGGDATIVSNAQSGVNLGQNATLGNARLIINEFGEVDFSGTTGPLGNYELSAGSIEGAGSFWLGANQLTVGGNGLSTTVSGIISDCGPVSNPSCGAAFGFGIPGNVVPYTGGSLVKIGADTLTLSGANTYTGGTILEGGVVQVGIDTVGSPGSVVSSAIGTGPLSFAGGILQAGGNFTIANAALIEGAGGGIDANGDHFTYSGVIADGATPGALTIIDTANNGGVVALTGANTYSGGTILESGIAQVGVDTVGSPGAIVSSAIGTGTLIFAGGALQAGGNFTIANTAGVFGVGAIDSNGYAFTYSGTILDIGGPGALIIVDSSTNGGGVVTLSGANTYSGGTTICGTVCGAPGGSSIVRVGVDSVFNTPGDPTSGIVSSAIGTGTLTFDGGTLQGDGAFSSYTIANAAQITANGGTIDANTNFLTLSGDIADAAGAHGALTVTDSSGPGGIVVLSGANTYSGGTTISNGVFLQVTNNSSVGTGGVTLNGGAFQAGAGSLVFSNAFGLTSVVGGSAIDANGYTLTIAGNINDSGGPGALTIIDSFGGGTVIFTGANAYTGGTTICACGALQLGDAGTTGSIVGAVTNEGYFAIVNANTAGITSITTEGGQTQFFNANTAGTATITNEFGGETDFLDSSSAGSAKITNLNSVTAFGIPGGSDTSTAANATIDNNDGGTIFAAMSSAGSANITNRNYGGTEFFDSATGANATITNQMRGVTIFGAPGGADTPTAGNAAITNNSGSETDFNAFSTAGNATITTNSGAATYFYDNSTGGNARLIANGTGIVDFSGTIGPNSDGQVSAGSIEGSGIFHIGAGNTLTVGGNNLSTTVSGLIADYNPCGCFSAGPGALVKTGTGTLTLSGANTYSGGTEIAGGTLQLGNGGTSGSLVGDVQDGGALIFDRSNAYAFNGVISDEAGAHGAVVQAGSGTLTLTAANTYTGATTVSAGVLNVAGSLGQTAVTVASGGTLEGTGSIAGSVTIASGGTLTPGDAPGTINVGALTLNSGSILSYQLGTANVVGGATNDLTVVNGPLTINGGTLYVTNSGSFGLGVYQIIDYAGALGGGGQLTIGSLPNGDTGIIQTAIPGEVNLVVSGPGALTQFWDGATTAGDGTIHGGSGTWNNSAANWTTPNGTINASWQGGMAVFEGAAGTVTVGEAVSYQGLQFSTTGYVVAATGSGALTPTGVAPIIVDSGLTATISAPIVGAGGLQKTGLGTLVLTGTDTYAGGTDLNAGALGVGNSAALGAGGLSMAAGTTLQAVANNLVLDNTIALTGADTIDVQANALTLSGAISGAGSLAKIGSGELTLTAANTYAGGTDLNAGVLGVGNSAALGAGGLSMAAGTTLQAVANSLVLANTIALTGADTIDAQANALMLSGVVSGAGGLAKIGSGELMLTAVNTYAGGTDLNAGALGVGNSAALGAGGLSMAAGTTLQAVANNLVLANAVTLTGADTIDAQANSLTLSGVVSGAGSLAKIGSGELTLTAANTYAGGTYLNAGTLGVGNSAALGSGPLTMQDGTILQFTANGLNLANAIIFPGVDPTIDTQGNNETMSGVISGIGGLTKIGAGSLDLTATNTYTGATIVSVGALVVDGSIASSSSLTIAPGATLGGSGTVPGFVVPAGATVAPGALTPYNTLHVAGALGFLSGSTYVVDVDAAGASDKIAATGAATLSGGTVNVLAASGSYSTATRFTILTAAGGVSGAFASLTTSSNLAFLTPGLSYDADDVYLGFAQTAAFPSVAMTPNQNAVATTLQILGPGAPLYTAVVGQSVAGARAAFDALSGEIHASAVSSAFDDARLPREAVLDRLSSPYGALPVGGGAAGFAAMNAIAAPTLPADVFAAWGQAFGSFGHIGGDGNAATVDRSMGGFILGVDATLDNRYRLGVAAGYSQSSFTIDARGSSGHVDSTFAGLYGGASLNALQLRGGAFYAYNRYGADRAISFPGFYDTASSGYGGDTLQAFGEAGWRLPMAGLAGPTFVEPFVGLMAMHIDTASFTEAGGAAALIGASRGYDYGATTLGVRAEATLFSGVPLLARGMLGWRHVFGDVTPSSTLAFASAPSIPFAISGAPIARDALVVEAGFDWKLTNNATVGVFYSGALGDRDEENAIKGKIEVAF